MTTTTPEAFPYIVSVVCAIAAGLERYRASKVATKTQQEKEVISQAKAQEERGNLYAKMANEYKDLLEKEYAAHEATRIYHHKKAGDDQAKLDRCFERCTELQAKTDITKIETLLLEQGKHLSTACDGIRELLTNCK